MTISDCIQGSPEWFAARLGRVSASNFGKIITPGGSKTEGKTRKDYLHKLAAERISGEAEESFSTQWTERGNEIEPDARLYFEQTMGLLVMQVGMAYLDDRRAISCSPDGLIAGENRGLEIKCCKLSTHVGYLDCGKLPGIYKPQVQGSMWVTGYASWFFMSYHPAMRPLIIEVDRDEKYITLLSEAVEEFEDELTKLVEKIR